MMLTERSETQAAGNDVLVETYTSRFKPGEMSSRSCWTDRLGGAWTPSVLAYTLRVVESRGRTDGDPACAGRRYLRRWHRTRYDHRPARDFTAQGFVDRGANPLGDFDGVDLVFDVVGAVMVERSATLSRRRGTLATIAGRREARTGTTWRST
jgi:hypothetical protein